MFRERERLDDQEKIEAEDDHDADESPLFAEHCEDEVCVAGGEEFELRLCAVSKSLAVNAAGSDGDLRLRHLVSRAKRIAFGIQENENALLLISLQHLPAEGER